MGETVIRESKLFKLEQNKPPSEFVKPVHRSLIVLRFAAYEYRLSCIPNGTLGVGVSSRICITFVACYPSVYLASTRCTVLAYWILPAFINPPTARQAQVYFFHFVCAYDGRQ